jgi:hypothetical protein
MVASGFIEDVARDDHTHMVDIPNTLSSSSGHLPPYYKLAFIMKE